MPPQETNGQFTTMFNQTSQYNAKVINTFESTFGDNFMSAGGLETTVETAEYLKPVLEGRKGGAKMLDVGCGIGGVGFYFASKYGAHVHGVDVNDVGINIANETLQSKGLQQGSCKFDTMDVTQQDFPDGSFDIIYSRDVLLHIPNDTKKLLFAKFQKWLTPGGMICICDYSIGEKSAVTVAPHFQAYMDARGYHLLTPPGYKKMFVEAGFDQDHVVAEDRQLWYCRVSQKEIDRVALPGPARDKFLETKTEDDLAMLEKSYNDKVKMTLRGDRTYVWLHAVKTQSHYNLRQEVVDSYKKMASDNLIMSCDGNVSARASDDTFLVTPSGVVIPDMTADMVVLCTQDGKPVAGESFKPSSESNLHDCVYKARPEVGAIVHSHSVFACALASCRLPLPASHYAVCELLQEFDFSAAAGGSTVPSLEDATVKCAQYHTYGTKALAKATLEGLGKNHAVIMANHGALVTGTNLEDAMYNVERLERECEIYWRALQMAGVGPTKPLTITEIGDLQRRDQTYGQEHAEEDEQ